MSKKSSSRISYEKLYAELFEVDDELVLEVDYLQWSEEVVDKLEQGIVDVELIAKIRLAACDDKKHLKGTYCIEIAKLRRKVKKLEKALKGTVKRNNEGKKFKATEMLIKSIYLNHKNKALPVKEFCKIAGISKNKYYRVINHDVEDAATVRYLKLLKKQVEED